MSPLFLLAIVPPLIWASINHLDKYAVDKYMHKYNSGALVIFTGCAGLIGALILLALHLVSQVPLGAALTMLFGGVFLVFSYIPYLYALDRDEASNVAPLFQLVTPSAYILALIFLREHITLSSLGAGAMIFLGAIALSFDFKTFKIRSRTFFLMLLASIMIATNVIIFKAVALETNFWTTVFYDLLGAGLAGMILFASVRSYMRSFIDVIREYKHKVILVNITAETLNIIARMISGFVTLTLPIAIVQFVNGLQPLFIIAVGVLLTRFLPGIAIESVDRRTLIQRFGACLLMLAGFIFLSTSL